MIWGLQRFIRVIRTDKGYDADFSFYDRIVRIVAEELNGQFRLTDIRPEHGGFYNRDGGCNRPGHQYLVYPPSKRKTIADSIRREMFRDAAEDYELLHLLTRQAATPRRIAGDWYRP